MNKKLTRKQPAKRGAGRPPAAVPLTRHLHMKITEAEHADLAAAAEAERRTITEVVRARLFGKGTP